MYFSPFAVIIKQEICAFLKLMRREYKFIKRVKYYNFSHTYEIVNRAKARLPNKGDYFIKLLIPRPTHLIWNLHYPDLDPLPEFIR